MILPSTKVRMSDLRGNANWATPLAVSKYFSDSKVESGRLMTTA